MIIVNLINKRQLPCTPRGMARGVRLKTPLLTRYILAILQHSDKSSLQVVSINPDVNSINKCLQEPITTGAWSSAPAAVI